MFSFVVNDMTCGHCASVINKALLAFDPGAHVRIDVPNRRIEVATAEGTLEDVSEAIREAGYTPVAV